MEISCHWKKKTYICPITCKIKHNRVISLQGFMYISRPLPLHVNHILSFIFGLVQLDASPFRFPASYTQKHMHKNVKLVFRNWLPNLSQTCPTLVPDLCSTCTRHSHVVLSLCLRQALSLKRNV